MLSSLREAGTAFVYLSFEERGKTMKRQTLVRVCIFAVTFAAAGLGAGARAAHAGVITLDASGIMSATSPATCVVGGCTLGGDMVIDNAAGTVISSDVTMAGETPSVGPFTSVVAIGPIFGVTRMAILDSANNNDLGLFFATPTSGSLVGYTGGPLSTFSVVRAFPAGTQLFSLDSGSLTERTPVSVPEPASVLLLASALAGACTLLGRRSLLN